MVGRSNPKSALRLFVQLPDCKCRHASNDSIAGDDGTFISGREHSRTSRLAKKAKHAAVENYRGELHRIRCGCKCCAAIASVS